MGSARTAPVAAQLVGRGTYKWEVSGSTPSPGVKSNLKRFVRGARGARGSKQTLVDSSLLPDCFIEGVKNKVKSIPYIVTFYNFSYADRGPPR